MRQALVLCGVYVVVSEQELGSEGLSETSHLEKLLWVAFLLSRVWNLQSPASRFRSCAMYGLAIQAPSVPAKMA
jgi:hypothetical protein